MARPREFDIEEVLGRASVVFARQGYHGTSIDDLVKATGLLRGSIYKAFGSKRNMFVAVLKTALDKLDEQTQNLDLLTVALKDLAADDLEIRRLCEAAVGNQEHEFALKLGKNLLAKLKEK